MGTTNIPVISQPVIDPRTGLMTREWYRFFRDPTFATLNVGGILGVGSGGTGLGSGTSGGVLAFTSATVIGSSALLTLNGPVLGGGAGGAPTSMTSGTDGQIVVGQTATAPAWKAVSGDAALAKTGALAVTSVTGVTDGSDAAAGKVGEVISSTVAAASASGLSTGVSADVTSISLTAGDWDVYGVVDYTFGATTSYTALQQGISTTSATLGAQDTFSSHVTAANVPTAAVDAALPTPRVRLSLNATTTVYLVTKAAFTVSTLKAYGTISARRRR